SFALGKGDGSFQAAQTVWNASTPRAVAVGDFNSDGKQDILGTDSKGLTIATGDGAGKFTTKPTAITDARAVGFADFNGDAVADVPVASPPATAPGVIIQVPPGTGGGNLAPSLFTMGFANYTTMVIADLDGDGMLDAAVGHDYGVDVFFN